VLKEIFTKKLILAVPDLDKKMRMEVDILDYAIVATTRHKVQ